MNNSNSVLRSSKLAAVLISLLLGPRFCAALELIKDGKPLAVIVIEAPAVPEAPAAKGKSKQNKGARGLAGDDAHAAEVLADWFEKISGAKLEVAHTPPQDGVTIYVGAAAVNAGLKLEQIQSPSHEGVRIIADDKRVLIGGQSGPATLKAACRFLEELGCRYFMDNPLGEVYPHSPTVSVGALDISEAPGFLYRDPKGPSWNGYASQLWRVWNGQGGENLEHSHSWGRYVPNSLFGTHPEFFAMNAEGERVNKGWLCTSNPALRDYFADRVSEHIAGGSRNPSISPTDGRGYCQCAACKAQDNPKEIEPSSGTLSISRRYVDFFNAVGKKVAEKYPESILSFYCYADYTQPPEGMTCAPNLCAFIAPIRYCRLHGMDNLNCPSRQQERTMIDGWAKEAKQTGYYDYNYDLADATLPLSRISVLKHDIPYLKSKGCIGLTVETLTNWHIYGPQIYLATRLAYAPDANADAIMDDYFLKFYGPQAGPQMKEYWMNIDAAQRKLSCHSGSFFGAAQLYTPAFLAQLKQILARATEAAAGDKTYAARVAVHAEGFKSAEEYTQIMDLMNTGNFAGGQAAYKRMTERLEKLAADGYANREYATAYLRRFVEKGIEAGVAATAAPNKLVAVLPDEWRFAWDEKSAGLDTGWEKPDFDDANWKRIATYGKTLDAQGLEDKLTTLWYRTTIDAPAARRKLALFFTQVDGLAEVYVNGVKAGASDKRNQAFEIDISAAVKDGKNSIAVRVDHSRMTELFLGGILRPVLLIDKP